MSKTLLTLLAAPLLVLAGYVYSGIQQSSAALDEHSFRVSAVPDAELKFLKTLDSSQLLPSKLESGIYVLEIQMPKGERTRRTLDIPFRNNDFAFETPANPGRVGIEESAKIEGHAVSWHDEGVLYDAGVNYVGVVSGSQMHGHVYNYLQTSEGEIGFWRMYPQPQTLDEPR